MHPNMRRKLLLTIFEAYLHVPEMASAGKTSLVCALSDLWGNKIESYWAVNMANRTIVKNSKNKPDFHLALISTF